MRRSFFFLIAVLAGCARVPAVSTDASHGSHAKDLAAIDELHRADVAATLSRNPRLLAALWVNDAVRMQPGGPAEIGVRSIYVDDSTQHSLSPRTQVIRYSPVIRDVQIAGDWAIEWGSFDGAFKQSPDDSVHVIRGNLLRVLRRQPDGSWRFARVMWNSAE